MRLEEQVRPHAQYWDCYNDEPEKYNHTNKLIKIAEDFAIGFAEWIEKYQGGTPNLKVLKELLEIYKKTL
jgi:hypothetical protein